MDMHTPVSIPGEQAAGVAAPTMSAKPPPFWRTLPALLSRRTILASGAAVIVLVGTSVFVLSSHQVPMLEPTLPSVPPARIAALEPAPPIPLIPPPTAEPDRQVAASVPSPPPAVAPAVTAAPAAVEPDPLAEERRLLREATAPIPPTVALPRNEEVSKLAAMTTQVAAMLREALQAQIELRKRLEGLEARVAETTLGQNQRLNNLEAMQAVAAARGVAPPVQPAAVPAIAHAPAPRSANGSTTYRITGASTNLVFLVPINPAPGDPPSVTASVGSDLPGFGKVRGIQQRGTTWVVSTDRGEIVSN